MSLRSVTLLPLIFAAASPVAVITTLSDSATVTSIPAPPSNVIVSKLLSATTLLLPSVSLPKANACGTTESIVIVSAFTSDVITTLAPALRSTLVLLNGVEPFVTVILLISPDVFATSTLAIKASISVEL